MKIPATAYVLTLNNAATLPACLESLREFDEILVLDGNSTDGTLKIAEELGAHVIQQSDDATPNRRIDNFSEVRARAFQAAKHDWIFQLDSDEVVSLDLIESVRNTVEAGDPACALRFRRLAVIDGLVIRHAYFYPEWCVRLINRKSGISWNQKRAVHERLVIPPGVRMVDGNGEILQTWPSLKECRAKDRRYLALATGPLAASSIPVKKVLRASIVNVAKGFYVLGKIAFLSIARKPATLPFAYHMRFPAYHFSFAVRLAALALRRSVTTPHTLRPTP